MKRIINYSFVVLLSVLAFTSCDTDKYEYTAQSNPDLSGFFLYKVNSSYTVNFDDDQVFYFYVKRNDSTAAATATLVTTVDADNGTFNVPSSVSFAAGQGTALVPVTFSMDPGNATLNIEIAEDQKYGWGQTGATISIIRNGKELAGTFVSEFYGEQWNVTVYYMGNSTYKIADCYESGRDISIVKNEDNTVTVSSQYAWTHSSYGGVYVIDYDSYQESEPGNSVFDAEDLSFTMYLVHYVPGVGAFGAFKEVLYLDEDVEE